MKRLVEPSEYAEMKGYHEEYAGVERASLVGEAGMLEEGVGQAIVLGAGRPEDKAATRIQGHVRKKASRKRLVPAASAAPSSAVCSASGTGLDEWGSRRWPSPGCAAHARPARAPRAARGFCAPPRPSLRRVPYRWSCGAANKLSAQTLYELVRRASTNSAHLLVPNSNSTKKVCEPDIHR